MLKRIVSIVIIAAMLCGGCAVYAEDVDKYYSELMLRYAAPTVFENMDCNLSRGTCVASLMRIVGVDEESAYLGDNRTSEPPTYYDVGTENANRGYIVLSKGYISTGYTIDVEYRTLTGDPSNPVDISTREEDYFFPWQDVTLKECLTFMLRCLKRKEDVKWETVMDDSVSAGLLTSYEREVMDENAPITKRVFSKILLRLFMMNRYLYFVFDEKFGYFDYDEERSIPYVYLYEDLIYGRRYGEWEYSH